MPVSSPKTETYLDALPLWAGELSEKYYSRSFALFLLSGNVRDLVQLRKADCTDFVPIEDFLFNALFGQRDLVLHYDRGGLSFGSIRKEACRVVRTQCSICWTTICVYASLTAGKLGW